MDLEKENNNLYELQKLLSSSCFWKMSNLCELVFCGVKCSLQPLWKAFLQYRMNGAEQDIKKGMDRLLAADHLERPRNIFWIYSKALNCSFHISKWLKKYVFLQFGVSKKKGFPVAFHASTHQNIIEISTLALDEGEIWGKKPAL